ncbi:MAG: TorF family putative porin [Gammaproteobacteria bacterium]
MQKLSSTGAYILSAAATLALLLVAVPAKAGLSFDGSVSYVSNYVFRGVSNTNEKIAVQSGFNLDSGGLIQAGFWESNSAVGDLGADAGLELNFYLSFRLQPSRGEGPELGILDYIFVHDDSLNYVELFIKSGEIFTGFNIDLYVSDSYEASESFASVLEFGYSVPLRLVGDANSSKKTDSSFTFDFTYGITNASDNIFAADQSSYTYWTAAIAFKLGKGELKAAYSDSDRTCLSQSLCERQQSIAWTHYF